MSINITNNHVNNSQLNIIQIFIPYTKFYKVKTKQYTLNYTLKDENRKQPYANTKKYYDIDEAKNLAEIQLHKYLAALTIQIYYRGYLYFN